MQIEILDSVHCKASKDLIPIIAPYLSYKDSYWRKGQYRSNEYTRTAYFIDRRSGIFLSGLFGRVVSILKKKNIKFDIVGKQSRLKPSSDPKLKGIKFRGDQLLSIFALFKKQRGVIVAPTGSGKTIVALGAMSSFKNCKKLFLVHTKELLYQAFEEAVNFGFKKVGIYGDGYKVDIKKKNIIIALVQSFHKLDPNKYCDYFDIIFIDEVHHAGSRSGTYGEILQHSLAQVKIGFTATLPSSKKSKFAIEGLVGKTIYELSIPKAIKNKIIAKPNINLIPVPKKRQVSRLTSYNDIYLKGVVNNRLRNRLIVREAIESVKEGKSVLIVVKRIKHGRNILKEAKAKKLKAKFIYSKSRNIEGAVDRIKKELNDKKIKCVISSPIWNEGVNIPTLDHVINAIGGKSRILVMQIPGRGYRRPKGKKNVKVTDFLDPYKYLAEHTVRRIQIYVEGGLL